MPNDKSKFTELTASTLKFSLTIEGDNNDLTRIAQLLSGGVNSASGAAFKDAVVHGMGDTKATGMKEVHIPLDEVVAQPDETEAEAEAEAEAVEEPAALDTQKADTSTPRPGTAAALLNDPSQPGQGHMTTTAASEGLNEPAEAEDAETVDLVIDPNNLTGELFTLAQTMEGRMETDGIQTSDKKRAAAGETVGFMYDATDQSQLSDATLVKTWRGKALIVDQDGDAHIVTGKELVSKAPTEGGGSDTPAPAAKPLKGADSDEVRQLYTEVSSLISSHRAVQIMIDVAGKKRLGDFSDDELAKAAAMLRHELAEFKGDAA